MEKNKQIEEQCRTYKNQSSTLQFNSKAHSQEIDSLRGIAAFLIFIFHAEGFISKNPGRLSGNFNILQSFIATGSTGVILFFILSGFLLSIPLLKNPKPDRIRFYKKRIVRIIPLYWLIVLIAGIITKVILNDPIKVIKSYFFLFDTWDLYPFSHIWWTLRTELQFYLILPVLLPLIHSRRGRIFLIFLIPMYTLILYICIPLIKTDLDVYFIFMQSIFRYAPTFMIGIIIAWIYIKYGHVISNYVKEHNFFKYGLSDIIIILAILLLSIVLQEVSLRGGTFAVEINWPQHFIYESILWGFILIGIILLPSFMKPLISNRYLAKYGEISYPFYFVHSPIIYYVSKYFSTFKSSWSLKSLLIIIV